MEETMNIESNVKDNKPSKPTVRENVTEELHRLRTQLSRTAHEIRMKSKGAGAEVKDTLTMLEREAKRFSAEVDEAVERTQEDLIRAGKDLQTRFEKLANQIAMPAN
jgi:light-regulated signal transduction histidine kinase (bacteriophytochrome)